MKVESVDYPLYERTEVEIKSRANPIYPSGEEGKAVGQFIVVVGKKGKVKDVAIVKIDGNQNLKDAMINSLRKWKFEPIKVKDEAIEFAVVQVMVLTK
ncbi:energy transducer TonB [Nibricoccus sp. IMCC34717]|uniref:energy transducer TonB n=1 Tax=Nibricoccus sp. IMCC34717 TaxID=3034021 RepID=UPI00384CBE80